MSQGSVVGVVGVGQVGGRIARSLVDAGYQVVAYDLSREALERAEQHGVEPCAGPGGVGQRAETVLLSLPGSDAVEQVVLGPDGLVSRMAQLRMWEAIRTAGGASGAVERGMPAMVRHELGTGGQLALHHRDMAYVLATADEIGAEVPFSRVLREVFGETLEHGDRRWAQLGCVTYWERRMGISVASAE